MGKFSKGILGGFSGKVGNVVGGNWKGIDYMRSNSSFKNNNPSEAQLSQQLKFGMCIRFVQSMSGLLEMSFNNFAVKKTGVNSALSYTLKNAVTGVYPLFSIDYANVLVSRGDLPNVLAPGVIMGVGSQLVYSWTDNTGVGVAKATDKAMPVAYCPDLNQCIYMTAGADRSALTETLNLAAFSGKTVETYLGFISETGLNVAGSLYTGSVLVS
jgi:hypothetical protein